MRPINTKFAAGYTLIEMTVVIALIGLLSIAISSFFSYGNKSYREGMQKIDTDEICAKAVRDVEKNARGATEITEATANTFEFYAFLRDDIHPAPSKVRYYLANGELIRSTIAPEGSGPTFTYMENNKKVEIIAEHVVGAEIFSYYNDASSTLSFPVQTDAIKMVEFSIAIDFNTVTPPGPAVQSTFVQFRNLKTNL
ncbi:MAG TPA: type II secretion system protein [bacterium]|nr:type II secretion system protein [bacterium]